MKITIVDRDPQEEDEIIIRCNELDDSLLDLINAFKIGHQKISASKEDAICMIDPKDIYYVEAVDSKVFLYCSNDVYETKLKLYEIEQEFNGANLFRAGKSTILNLSKVKSLSPAFSGRFEALLKNGEKVIISRQYVNDLKKRLGF